MQAPLGETLRLRITIMTATLGLFLVTGCAEHGSYRGVEALKDAFVNAGGSCLYWDQNDWGLLSEEFGSCGTSAQLFFYGDDTERYDETYATMQELDAPMIVGDNWIIQAEFDDFGEGHKLAHDIGGIYDKGAYR